MGSKIRQYYQHLVNVPATYLALFCLFRYFAICHPMKVKYISTPGRAKRIIAGIWVAAILFSSVFAVNVLGVGMKIFK